MRGVSFIPDEMKTPGSGHLETSDSGRSQPGAGEMSAKEHDRLRLIQLVMERRLTRVKAGQSLGITARQVARLCDAYQREGAAGLVSRKRGRIGNRRLPAAVEAQVVEHARRFYQGLGPTLVRKELAERHGINLAKETVRKVLSRAGLWSPKTKTPQER